MKNKWIVVTGASSGIGFATAKILLNNDYKVVLSSRNSHDLEEQFMSFNKDDYAIIPFDFSVIKDIKKYKEIVFSKVGKISGLVHCAGKTDILPLELYTYEKILGLFSTNTFSAFELIKQFVNDGFEEHGSSIVLVSSYTTREGSLGQSIYAATKGAIEGYLKSAAIELLKKNIRINVIVPGLVKSRMTEKYLNKLDENKLKKVEEKYPLGIGSPENVAGLIEFLISEKSSWMTGQQIIIDGGRSLT